jgi:prepilin-type N-terminal cleavage/methylation domain-containing protein
MTLHRRRPRRRSGFTLIELLVVIAIIAVLISLTSAAVFYAFVKMDEVRARNEVSQMASGVAQFEGDFNVTVPPPSRIWLDGSGLTAYSTPPAGYTATDMPKLYQLGQDSQAYLRKLWPRINIAGGIAWNGGQANLPNNVVLEGQQCLVFFLGGARNANGAFIGFSTDTTNPMNGSTTTRKGPYFQFDMKRIQAGPNGYPQYLDPYGAQPYAYFSSGKTNNAYNAYVTTGLGLDCPSLGLQPYYSSPNPNQYYNPSTFQIISAGRDKTFGPGGQWTPTTANGIAPAGRDDISNFYDRKLGINE